MGLLGILVIARDRRAGYRTLDTTTVVLVRHAEKELSTIDDPPLAPDGELRAERLSLLFGKVSGHRAAGGNLRLGHAALAADCRAARDAPAPRAHRRAG